jgi:hypothetical protein
MVLPIGPSYRLLKEEVLDEDIEATVKRGVKGSEK